MLLLYTTRSGCVTPLGMHIRRRSLSLARGHMPSAAQASRACSTSASNLVFGLQIDNTSGYERP